jgi:flagellar basal-body rod protein FlgB
MAMLNQIGATLTNHGDALKSHAERQRTLAANIANADMPNYKAMDFDFKAALQIATVGQSSSSAGIGTARTNARHLSTSTLSLPGIDMQYRTPNQLSIDGNSVEVDTQRAGFADNAVRYEASLRFLNSEIKILTMAIQGQ